MFLVRLSACRRESRPEHVRSIGDGLQSVADASLVDPTRLLADVVGDAAAGVSALVDVRVVHAVGHRPGRAHHAPHRGRHARRCRGGCAGVVPLRVPVLLPVHVGHRPARARHRPADRGAAAARGRAHRGRGGRHPVPPLGQEGAPRVLDPRRRRPRPGQTRPRQPVGDHRDRRAVAVLQPSGVPADPVSALGRQGHRLPGGAGRPDALPTDENLPAQ